MNNQVHSNILCLVCGGKTRTINPMNAISFVHECLNCRHAFYSPPPEKSVLNKLYLDEKYYDEGPEVENRAVYLWERRFRSLAKSLPQRGGSVLDVGCGKGVFLQFAKTSGLKVYGTEYSAYTAKYAGEKYGIYPLISDLLEAKYESNFFDMITFWHVLEHLASPPYYIHEAGRIIKKGGKLVIELPNRDCFRTSLDKQISQNRTHLQFFSKKSLECIIGNNGFKIVSMKYYDPRDYKNKISSKIHHFLEESIIRGIDSVTGKAIGSTIRVVAEKT